MSDSRHNSDWMRLFSASDSDPAHNHDSSFAELIPDQKMSSDDSVSLNDFQHFLKTQSKNDHHDEITILDILRSKGTRKNREEAPTPSNPSSRRNSLSG